MTIDYRKLKSWLFVDVVHIYTVWDCMLYVFGLGLGVDLFDAQ